MKTNKMNNAYSALHPKQIPTSLKIIKSQLFFSGQSAINHLISCAVCVPGSLRQVNHIIIAAECFERLSRLVYRNGQGRFCKPKAEDYYNEIFINHAETPGEIFSLSNLKDGVTPERAEEIYKIIHKTAEIVCPMMACVEEQAFLSEYAYAIEYVLTHKGDLPKPGVDGIFPTNYKDYRPQEKIACEIRKYGLL